MHLRSNWRGATVLACASGLALVFAAPVAAQTTQAGQQPPAAKPNDPNRIICQRVEETGSRIAAHKVCLTAQQWEEKRRSDRSYVEDAQQRSLEPNSSG